MNLSMTAPNPLYCDLKQPASRDCKLIFCTGCEMSHLEKDDKTFDMTDVFCLIRT